MFIVVNFCLEYVVLLFLGDGEVLLCNCYFLLDLYMCGCMDEGLFYVVLVVVGVVMEG